MRIAKSNGSTEVDQTLEKDIAKNIQELTRAGAALRQPENGNDEMSANNLGTLFVGRLIYRCAKLKTLSMSFTRCARN
jgi:hypothetical protein